LVTRLKLKNAGSKTNLVYLNIMNSNWLLHMSEQT